jgi:hypothetical protein
MYPLHVVYNLAMVKLASSNNDSDGWAGEVLKAVMS